MSTFIQIEALFGPALIVWLMLRPNVHDRSFGSTLELMGTAGALALGWTSISFFFWRFAGMQPSSYVAADIGVQALILGGIWYKQRRPSSAAISPATAIEPTRWQIAGGALAGAALLLGTGLLTHTLTELPYGWSDGWSIWNLRAAFLSVPNEHWRDGFTTVLGWSHPDYPLLVPASIARLWTMGESTSAFAPRLFAVAVVIASSLTLAGNVVRHAGIIAMALALSLLLIPSYVYWGASQTADVPLGLYMLTAVSALSAGAAGTGYVVAGLAAGFAMWTKNEGIVVASAVVVVAVVLAVRSHRDRRLVARFAAGVAVAAVAVLLFKLVLAPPTDLLHQILRDQPLQKAADFDRHVFVLRYMVSESIAWGNWFLLPPSVVLLACVGLAAFRWRDVPARVAIGGAVAAVTVGGYYWIYVLSPYELQWHLNTSWPRLVAQVWPTIVWTIVIAAFSHSERSEASRDTPRSVRSSPRPPFQSP